MTPLDMKPRLNELEQFSVKPRLTDLIQTESSKDNQKFRIKQNCYKILKVADVFI